MRSLLALTVVVLLLCKILDAATPVADYIIVGAGPTGLLTAYSLYLSSAAKLEPPPSIVILDVGEEPDIDNGNIFPRLTYQLPYDNKKVRTLFSERENGAFGKIFPILAPRGGARLGYQVTNDDATVLLQALGFDSDWVAALATLATMTATAPINLEVFKQDSPAGGLTAEFLAAFSGAGADAEAAKYFKSETAPFNLLLEGYLVALMQSIPGFSFNVLYNARVSKVVVDVYSTPKVATGVEYVQNGVKKAAHCNKEVVLAAGTFGSPQILELSGIGDMTRLATAGISPIVHLPEVGENLILYPEFPVVHLSNTLYTEQDLSLMSDPATFDVSAPHDFAMADSVSAEAHFQGFTVQHSTALPPSVYPQKAVLSNCVVSKPKSRGSTHVRSKDPRATPSINTGLFSDQDDLVSAASCLGTIRTLAAAEPLISLLVAELLPDQLAADTETTAFYIMGQSKPTSSSGGTCSIGTVLENDLRVVGFDNLRVVGTPALSVPVEGGSHYMGFLISLVAGIFMEEDDYTVNIDITRGLDVTYLNHGFALVEDAMEGDSNVCDQIGANNVKPDSSPCVIDDIISQVSTMIGTEDFWVAPSGGSCRVFDGLAFDSCSNTRPVLCKVKGAQI